MKLGLGIYDPRSEYAGDANSVGADAVLLFFRALDLADRIADGIEIIGRDYWSIQQQDDVLKSTDEPDDLHSVGRTWAQILCRQFPRITVWQALNEVMRSGSLDWLQRQVWFELGFADGCQENGRRACVLNPPPGVYPVPSEPFWPDFTATVKPLLEHPATKYLGLHAYGKDRNSRLDVDPDWYALRHRQLAAGLRAAGVRVPSIAITELGHESGWRAVPLEDYQAADDFCWFGDQIWPDKDVEHVFLFCAGDTGGWSLFDVHETGIIPRLAEWNRAHPRMQDDEPTAVERVLREWDAEHKEPNMDETTQNALIEMEARQNAELTGALVAILKGNLWDGAESVAGRVVALTGKSLDELGISPK